ncbi:MAG: SdpI family protein [Firmicutes bacterium]|nr:SdpI family protein [Bacillota bacterium]
MGTWFVGIYGIIPILMIFSGTWLFIAPPKKPNFVYGYRTTMSRKNKDTWIFANQYSGRLLIIFGVIALIVSAIVCIFLLRNDHEAGKVGTFGRILIGVQLLFMIAVIPFTEKALRANFDKSGNRK